MNGDNFRFSFSYTNSFAEQVWCVTVCLNVFLCILDVKLATEGRGSKKHDDVDVTWYVKRWIALTHILY